MATPIALRPLSIGEILDAGIKILTRYWKTLLLCTVPIVLPVEIVYTLIVASISPNSLKLVPDTNRQNPDQIDWSAFGGVILAALIIAILFLVVYAACFKAVSDAWLGVAPTARRSLKFGLFRFPSLLALWLVWLPAIIIGLIPLGILAAWLLVVWSLSIPALLFERRGPFRALGRSYDLVDKRFWATALLVLVGYIGVGIIGSIFQFLLLGIASLATHDSQVANGIAEVIGGTVSTSLTLPYLCAVLTILYFDQRVRKEGFDLQLMAEGLGADRDPDAPLPEPLIGALPAPRPYYPPQTGWGQQPQWPQSYGGYAPPQPGEQTAWPGREPPAPQEPHGGPWAPPSAPGDSGAATGGYAPPGADAPPSGEVAPGAPNDYTPEPPPPGEDEPGDP